MGLNQTPECESVSRELLYSKLCKEPNRDLKGTAGTARLIVWDWKAVSGRDSTLTGLLVFLSYLLSWFYGNGLIYGEGKGMCVKEGRKLKN